jgi:DNA-binding response OmpR family regulator
VSKPKVMLVEDEVLVAMMMEDVLAEWGWDVAGSFGQVQPAVDWLVDRAEALDAAVLDINLGGEMVFPVAEALKARRVPFLFLTGYTAPTGAADFGAPILNKPFNGEELESALNRLLETA